MTNPDFTSYLPEQFKEHLDHPGVWVGNQGTILTTRKGTKKMNPYGAQLHLVKMCNNHGYLQCRAGYVHRLVAQVWIPNPDNLPQVNHKDEDKLNNIVVLNDDLSVNFELSNLEWCTREYNNNYGTRNARVSASRKGKSTGPRSAETRAKMKGNQNAKGSTNKSTTGQKWYKDPDTGKRVYYIPDQSEA